MNTYMAKIKEFVRSLFPRSVVNAYRKRRYGHTWSDPGGGSLESVFSEIYREKFWGDNGGNFYSGPGSDDHVSRLHINAVKHLIQSRGIKSILDVGCGDFRVGCQLISPDLQYIGVDVVPAVVSHNQREFGAPNVRFGLLDATEKNFPPADLCHIRQVLQHLSNDNIKAILQKATAFKDVVISEHMLPPDSVIVANEDIKSGMETRLEIGSCVRVDLPPFSWRIVEHLCEIPQPDGSNISTMLVAPPSS